MSVKVEPMEHDQLPELPPEVKINMKLDDIIKYTKMKEGVSHNLQFNRHRYNQNRDSKPWLWNRRRRFRSQNWRLGGNGPNSRRCKIRAFIEKKWQSKPLNSVFHRLGWTPAQQAAQYKLSSAIRYRKPTRLFPFRKTLWAMPKPMHDPNRSQKLKTAANYYRTRYNGLNVPSSNMPTQTLNQVNLCKLSEALGGQITKVEEEADECGTVVTTITRVDNTYGDNLSVHSYNSGFSNRSTLVNHSNQSSMMHHNNRSNMMPNMNQANMMYNMNYCNPMNYGMNGLTVANLNNGFGMSGNLQNMRGSASSMYGNMWDNQLPSGASSVVSNGYNQFSNNFGMNQGNRGNFSDISITTASYQKNQYPNSQGLSDSTSLDLQSEIKQVQNGENSRGNVPKGIDAKVAIHTTNVPCSQRFQALSTQESLERSVSTLNQGGFDGMES